MRVLALAALAALAMATPLTDTVSTAVILEPTVGSDQLAVHIVRTDDLLTDETPSEERRLILERITHVLIKISLDKTVGVVNPLRINDEPVDLGLLPAQGRVQLSHAETLLVPESTAVTTGLVNTHSAEYEALAARYLPPGIVSTEVWIGEDSLPVRRMVPGYGGEEMAQTVKGFEIFVKITEVESLALAHTSTVLIPVLKLELAYRASSSVDASAPTSMKAFTIAPISVHYEAEDSPKDHRKGGPERHGKHPHGPSGGHRGPPSPFWARAMHSISQFLGIRPHHHHRGPHGPPRDHRRPHHGKDGEGEKDVESNESDELRVAATSSEDHPAPPHRGNGERPPPPPHHHDEDEERPHPPPPHRGPPGGPPHGPHHGRHGRHGHHEHRGPHFLCRLKCFVRRSFYRVKSYLSGGKHGERKHCHKKQKHGHEHKKPSDDPKEPKEPKAPSDEPTELSDEMDELSVLAHPWHRRPHHDRRPLYVFIAIKALLLGAVSFALLRRYRQRREGAIRLEEETVGGPADESVESAAGENVVSTPVVDEKVDVVVQA